jgi:large subunit ribosomal protein L18
MSVTRSNRRLSVQVIDDVKGHTLASASTLEKDFRDIKATVEGGGKLGEIFGKRLLEKNISEVVFDRNGYLYHGVVKAIAEGARKAGIKF